LGVGVCLRAVAFLRELYKAVTQDEDDAVFWDTTPCRLVEEAD